MSQIRIHTFLAVLTAAGLLATASAYAQDGAQLETGAPAAEKQDGPPVTVNLGGSYQFEADIDESGEFTIARLNLGLRAPIDLTEDLELLLSARYDLAEFNFQSMPDPWDTVHSVTLMPLLQWQLDERWALMGGPLVRFSGETEADFGDSLTGGALIGARYTRDETFSIGFGLALMSSIEDDARVVPVVMMRWQFAEDWGLHLGFLDVTTMGMGAEVLWAFAENFQFTWGVHYHQQRFRLDDDAANPDGVGEESAFNLFARVNWQTCKSFALQAYLGMGVGGELRVEDDGGNKVFENDYDPAPIAGINGVITF